MRVFAGVREHLCVRGLARIRSVRAYVSACDDILRVCARAPSQPSAHFICVIRATVYTHTHSVCAAQRVTRGEKVGEEEMRMYGMICDMC